MSKTVFTLFTVLLVGSSAFAMEPDSSDKFIVPLGREADALEYWDEIYPLEKLQEWWENYNRLRSALGHRVASEDALFKEHCPLCIEGRNATDIPVELRHGMRRHLFVTHAFLFTGIELQQWLQGNELPKDLTTV